MERVVTSHIGKLAEGVHLATSDDVHGLVIQERTIPEAIEIASDVAMKLPEMQGEAVDDRMDRPANHSA
jgi:hypothetical protein